MKKTKAKTSPGQKAKAAAKKKAKKGPEPDKKKYQRGGKASRDWSRVKRKWLESPLKLEAFLRAEKIPLSTGKRYLSVREKNKVLRGALDGAKDFRDRLIAEGAKENGRAYVAALKRVTTAVQEVLLDSAERFKDRLQPMSERDAGRLVLAAGEMLVKTTSELQGIPESHDAHGWPLTKEFWPLPYQRDFLFDTPASLKLEGREGFVFAFIGGVGSGKTFTGAEKSGWVAWENRGHVGMILAPTYRMLEDATKRTFFEALHRKGLSYRYLKTENAIILFGDTKILFRSMDEPAHIRGPNIAWAWVDEGAQLRTREAYDIILARIRDPEAPARCLIFTSTPDGLNWAFDVLVTEAERNKVQLYRGRTKDNPHLGDYEARLRSSYDSRFAAQELDAEFLNIFAGQAYWNFSPIESVFDPKDLSIEPSLPLDVYCDFNVAPMCWNIGQDYRQNGDVWTYIVDELHLDTAGTEVTAEELVSRYPAHRAGFRIYGDSTAQHVRATNASRSDYEIIEERLKAAGLPFETIIGRSNPRQSDRVAAVNARLKNALGTRRLYISRACTHTITDFEKTAFVPGTRQLDKGSSSREKRERTHHTDAIGYGVNYKWPIRGPEIIQRRTR